MKNISKEHRKAISISMKGNKNYLNNVGSKRSLETKLKMSKAKLGNSNPNWKGGITEKWQIIRNSLEYREWRLKVFIRDKFTCILCGDDRGGNLEADHIKRLSKFPHLAFVISNGRTLCKKCHWPITRNQLKKK